MTQATTEFRDIETGEWIAGLDFLYHAVYDDFIKIHGHEYCILEIEYDNILNKGASIARVFKVKKVQL